MKLRQILPLASLILAGLGVAQAQEAIAPAASTIPAGINFAYDPVHGHFSASGYSISPTHTTSSATTTLTGTIDVTINVNLVSKNEAGTSFPCAAIAIGGKLNTNNFTVDGGIETVNGVAPTVAATPNSVTCSLTIPYSWTIQGGRGATGLIIAFTVVSVNGEGVEQHSTLQVFGIDNLPANGATTKYTFNAAL